MVMATRRNILAQAGVQFNGARDLYETFGYERTITPAMYQAEYQRGDLAARLVDAFPDATWRLDPIALGERQVTESWYSVWEDMRLDSVLHRLDRLMSLGRFAILVLGLDGGEPMDKPASGRYSLLYLQPYGESAVTIEKYDDDPKSARFGKPELYNVSQDAEGRKISFTVHHTRVIHVAEKQLEDVSFGQPRLERVWNRIQDVNKLIGGGAEVYWQNAAMLMVLQAAADSELDPDSKEAMKDQITEMQHGMRRWMTLQGVDAKNISPSSAADPSALIMTVIMFIAAAHGVPNRILMGSEAGELASSQDEGNWASIINARQNQWATPTVLVPLARRFAEFGIIAGELEGFEWDPSDTLSQNMRADIAQKFAASIASYTSNPNNELVVAPDEFRQMLGLEKMIDVEDDYEFDDIEPAEPLRSLDDV